MPLVVPKLGANAQEEWMSKLLGKTLTDGDHSETAFARRDLPKDAVVAPAGAMLSTDHNPDRMVIQLSEDGTVANVKLG